ncbi:MAG: hypothetical protein MI757_18845 [Pirellulales bacterium]|nr:hypothetical protein [Pirellulales bacterium]
MSLFFKRVALASIVSAFALGCMFPIGSFAQDAPAEPAAKDEKVFARPKTFRKLAPDVLTTIPVHREAEECYTTMSSPDLSLVVKADPKLQAVPKVGPETATLREQVTEVTFRRPVWNLEFTFKPLRMIRVDLPQPSGKMRKKLIWYMIYKVRNPGQHFAPVRDANGELKLERPDEIDPANPGVRFVPFFILQENREVNRFFREKIIPLAMPQILRREFRTGEFKAPEVLNSAQMAQQRIKAGEERWGVVTWENVDPRIDFLTIFIQGLSNAYEWQETRQSYSHSGVPAVGRKLKRKTLQLNFWRPGDEYFETEQEIIYGIPGEYVKPKEGQRRNPGWLDHEWLYR